MIKQKLMHILYKVIKPKKLHFVFYSINFIKNQVKNY